MMRRLLILPLLLPLIACNSGETKSENRAGKTEKSEKVEILSQERDKAADAAAVEFRDIAVTVVLLGSYSKEE